MNSLTSKGNLIIGIGIGLMLAGFIVLAFGCTGQGKTDTIKQPTGWCEQAPKGTQPVLCIIGAEIGVRPEDLSTGLKIANLIGTDQWYEAQEIYDLFSRLQKAVKVMRRNEAGTLWVDFGTLVLAEFNVLSPKAQAALILAENWFKYRSPVTDMLPLTDYDWVGIERHIDDQLRLIRPYLKTT